MATKTLEITAGTSQFEAALASATASLVEATTTWKENLASVKESFAVVGEAMVAVTAIMAGGAVFKDMIQSTVKLNIESRDLGKQFGISATEASVLRAALAETHVTQEQFSAAGARVLRTLNTNESAFKELGVATRDANGNFRPLADIILDTNTALLTFKEGTDRGLEATKIYGKGWQEIAPTLRLTRDATQAAKESVDDLGLAVTKQSEAMTGQYQDAMVRVQHTLDGIENAIGQAVIPVLTDLGNWFRSIGPEVIHAFRIALDGLKVVFSAVTDAVKELWQADMDLLAIFKDGISTMFGGDSISAMTFFANVLKVIEVAFIGFRTAVQLTIAVVQNEFEYLVDLVHGWATVIEAAFHLNWAGVRAAWKEGQAKIEADLQAHAQRLVAIAEKAQKDMSDAAIAVMGQPAKGTPTDAPASGKTSEGGKDKFKNELDEWIRTLDLEYAALKKQHEAEMLVYQQQEAEFSKAAGARVAIAEQEVAAEARAYGAGSPQYERAQKHLIEIKQQAEDQLRSMADEFSKLEETRALYQVSIDQKALQQQLANHEISNAEFEQQALALENRRTAIAEKGARDRLAITDPTTDPKTFATLLAQLESLEQQHAQKVTQIREQAARRDKQLQDQLFKGIQNDFSQSIAGMLKGTQTFTQGVRGLFQSVLGSIVDFLAQWAAQWAATQILNMAASKAAAVQTVGAQAASAGAAGVASFAGAPWPIDLGAPAFGAAMAADALSYGLGSAERGYDIPAGVNPMMQLHQREMVLPEWAGDVIRGLATTGGGQGGIGAGGMNVYITATDARSLHRALTGNGANGPLANALRGLGSRFVRGA